MIANKNKATSWTFLWILKPENKVNPAIKMETRRERCSKISFSKKAIPVKGANRIIKGNAKQ